MKSCIGLILTIPMQLERVQMGVVCERYHVLSTFPNKKSFCWLHSLYSPYKLIFQTVMTRGRVTWIVDWEEVLMWHGIILTRGKWWFGIWCGKWLHGPIEGRHMACSEWRGRYHVAQPRVSMWHPVIDLCGKMYMESTRVKPGTSTKARVSVRAELLAHLPFVSYPYITSYVFKFELMFIQAEKGLRFSPNP
jgi:hypothetical protein